MSYWSYIRDSWGLGLQSKTNKILLRPKKAVYRPFFQRRFLGQSLRFDQWTCARFRNPDSLTAGEEVHKKF